MRNSVLVARAGAAWDTLQRWCAYEQARSKQAADLLRQHPKAARVTFVASDPRLEPASDEPDWLARVHSLAAVCVEQHQFYVKKGWDAEKNADALQAWRLVLRARTMAEVERRMRVAIQASVS